MQSIILGNKLGGFMNNNNPYNNNPYAQYKNTQIQTATPGQLILLLYEGGIKFCKLAKANIDEKNIMGANTNIIKVIQWVY